MYRIYFLRVGKKWFKWSRKNFNRTTLEWELCEIFFLAQFVIMFQLCTLFVKMYTLQCTDFFKHFLFIFISFHPIMELYFLILSFPVCWRHKWLLFIIQVICILFISLTGNAVAFYSLMHMIVFINSYSFYVLFHSFLHICVRANKKN